MVTEVTQSNQPVIQLQQNVEDDETAKTPAVSKGPESETRDLQIKILLHEHAMIRGEVLLMLTFYKSHFRVLQLSATGILALIYLYATGVVPTIPKTVVNWGLGFAVISMIPVLCGYMILDILHTMYTMVLLGTRTRTIEENVTRLAGPNLMMWEQIASVFFNEWRPGGVSNPSGFHAVLSILVILALVLAVPLFGYVYLLNAAPEAGVSNPIGWIGFGIIFTAAIVWGCLFYGVEVLQKMRPKAKKFVSKLIQKQGENTDKDETG